MKLTLNEFAEVSALEGIGINELRTIFQVEAQGNGHLPDGKPKILFEGHKFYAHLADRPVLRAKIMQVNPGICHPAWTKKNYVGGQGEWRRLDLAISHAREAALKSASWGAFQILGENHKAAGFATVQMFVNAMYGPERLHLIAVCKFIKSNKAMFRALLAHDWVTFARLYNGKDFAKNQYHIKLETAFNSLS